ncbi:hypothetical protein pqer_cds_1052 [Pandoravirus quercus]|uniref:PAN APPLE domain containing protein n=3 Tax=Pandoravirus TaxID=2060084 RepID=A0A2U7UAL3_9VIRU|nr:hypothetical protein TW95_gp0176 [Pandoravirus inopinatum]YP_009483743.1 hypothetical protein pqer_cds_1052 [Pandoravirus quercus]AJF96910.1 hypothetical protein [Pandoravirus inopinatum]AVK75474.1 hypothetical protein pqer_cds_1052 [Pandoravirus quercus]QBZ81654.1 hypothetical protein pclt_cds_1071 [Pandoravirus celtis]
MASVAGTPVVVAAPAVPVERGLGAAPWIIAGLLLALLVGALVGWLIYRARYEGGGGVVPTPTPTATGFAVQTGVNSIRTNLADEALSQRIADPSVGTYLGSAATQAACEAGCTSHAGCVQYVYDTNTRPANPLWQAHGCWVRFREPTAAEVVSEPGYITATRTSAPLA